MRRTIFLVTVLLLGACGVPSPLHEGRQPEPTEEQFATAEFTIEPASSVSGTDRGTAYGFTHQNPDGNRWVLGRGNLPESDPIAVQLAGTAQWLVGAPFRAGSLWVVVFVDGRVQAFYLVGSQIQQVALSRGSIPAGMPPLVQIQGDRAQIILAEDPQASTTTHPVVLDESGTIAYISTQGDLVVLGEGDPRHLEIEAIPDARILSDDEGSVLVLAGATDRYGHGIAGDPIEASEIVLIELSPEVRQVEDMVIPPPKVIEGIMPLWEDMDGDGEREIIVTTSDSVVGARFEVYDQGGKLVATSDPIGLGFRWRHQLVVAPFGPDGVIELATVRTPHIGGIVEFFRLEKDQLVKTAELGGYTSHVIGSRNLDMAVAGDFDGDDRIELLLPDQSLRTIGAIRRTEAAAETAWSVELEGKLSTNLSAVTLEDGSLQLGAATQEGYLWIWAP